MTPRLALALALAVPAAAQVAPDAAVWLRLEAGADLEAVAALGVTAVVLDEPAPVGRGADLVRHGLEAVWGGPASGPGLRVRSLPLWAFATGDLGAGPFAAAVVAALDGPPARVVTTADLPARSGTAERERRRAAELLHLALPGTPLLDAGSDSAFVRRAVALRRSSPALWAGDLGVVAVADRAVAFSRTRDGERWVVATNAGDRAAFLHLEGERPAPLWPVAASRPGVDVPGLVALFDDDGAVYGLRVPPRTTVVYRPVAPDDVRPRGLDE